MAFKGGINVLIYAGTGASPSAIHHTRQEITHLLSPHYSVSTISTDTLLKEPWQPACALLVFPGGADLGYCRALNGEGNRRIRQYVANGGKYIGFCAGGYYGSAKCEFELGDSSKEVDGTRELAFFPGACRGSAFAGFEYGSDNGTKAARLDVKKKSLGSAVAEVESFCCYANGGGYFVGAADMEKNGVEVLAEYADSLDLSNTGTKPAAIVYCQLEKGGVILTGPHPEFAIDNFNNAVKNARRDIYDILSRDEKPRRDFLRSCLQKLGLSTGEQDEPTPKLTPLHFSSIDPTRISAFVKSSQERLIRTNGSLIMRAEKDAFLFHPVDASDELQQYLNNLSITESAADESATPTKDRSDPLKLIVHNKYPPSAKQTPYFSIPNYFHSLSQYQSQHSPRPSQSFGNTILYGEVMTSTSTLLESNPTLTRALPAGTVCVATRQLSGRGRGSNTWVSPKGSLMFSVKFSHPLAESERAPVVFVQYLAAMAVVEAVKDYDPEDARYGELPVRLKWPNDVYVLAPEHMSKYEGMKEVNREQYVKIGGILVNTSYSGGDFNVILGIGVNLSNASPTTSLNALVDRYNGLHYDQRPLEFMEHERLLAGILTQFGRLYEIFLRGGFSGALERLYYSQWLHTDQIVTLEVADNAKARIKGISTDWGLLVAEEVDGHGGSKNGADDPGAKLGLGLSSSAFRSGNKFALQSDSNSFDFFKGLIKRKL